MSTAPTIPCKSEMSTICTQNIVRMKTAKEVSTNDEPEGAYIDRKRKFEAISVDTGFKEMVRSDSVFSNSLFSSLYKLLLLLFFLEKCFISSQNVLFLFVRVCVC